MGNNVGFFHSHSGSLRFPCHLQLGRSATIDLSPCVSTKWNDGSLFELCKVSYTVHGSTCNLRLTRLVYKDGNPNIITFSLHDSIICSNDEWLRLQIFRNENSFLPTTDFRSNGSIAWTKTNSTVDSWGGVTDTKVYLYGSGNRWGLLVLECKKKSRDDNEYANAVTVAHYFANSSATDFNRSTETDIGFSVVAKVRASNGNFDITVEGPEQHPVSALIYMFDKVNRSGIWKPSLCPHCDNLRRERSRMFWQSDSEEDSDHRDSQQSAVSIANHGRFRGHANGSYIRCKNFYGFN